jgi:UDP-glucose 4-epimerase
VIVVTGASGFIGWALVEELLRRGERVLAVSRSGSAPEGADRVAHDVRKTLVVDGNVEAVVHLAAMAAARRSFGGEWDVFESNVLSTINMARLALEKRALFVLASSAEVYGAVGDPSVWFSEDDCVCGGAPSSPYAASKVSAEVVARHYALRGLHVSVLRPTNTYGRLIFVRNEEARGYFVEKALCMMLSGVAELAFDGFGESMRQWMYYPDHVSAYLTLIYRSDPRPFEVYNAAGPRPASLKEVVETLAGIVKWRGVVRWGLNPRPVDPNYLLLHSNKLRALGWNPHYNIAEGLRDYVEKLGGRCT